MKSLLKLVGSGLFALALAGCLFDGDTQVAGGEDFPNTITPLGKVSANNIVASSNWDQFQSMDTTPDLSTDSLINTVALAKYAAAKVTATANGNFIDMDTVITLQKLDSTGLSTVQHIRVDLGSDGQLANKMDNEMESYDLLRSRNGDTLEWTQLRDADYDGNLWGYDGTAWGYGDFGVVEMTRQVKNPLARPTVARLTSTLKAWIYHRGRTSVPLSYTERCILTNGDTTVFTIKGVRGPDSLLIPGDSALVTFNRIPFKRDSLLQSKGRYWIRLGTLARPFADNSLLRYEIKNWYASGIIRYDSTAFTADSAVNSGNLNIRGNFVLLAMDETGSIQSQMTGTFLHDSIETDLHEIRDGKSKDYHVIYDKKGDVKERNKR